MRRLGAPSPLVVASLLLWLLGARGSWSHTLSARHHPYVAVHRRLPSGGRDEHRGDPRQRSQGDQQQGEDQRHRHRSSSSSHSSASAYGDVRRRKPRHYYTSLSDVLLCLVMALGWTVWLLSSFIKTDFSKYQHESVLVRGHVLHVSVEDDSLGTGIPTYKAIIDYMVPNTAAELDGAYYAAASGLAGSEHLAECGNIQIRKQFETSHLLTEGFANVELLVLPHEPTYSVLKDEWEKEYALHQHHQQRSMGTPAAQHNASTTTPAGATTNNNFYNSNTAAGLRSTSNTLVGGEASTLSDDDLEWWRSTWFRRATITGAALLVLASVAGGIQVVIRLRPSQQNWGWAMVVIGVPLLLPTAIGIHYALQRIQKTFDLKKTFIIRGAERLSARPCAPACGDLLDARACDEEDLTVLTSPTTCANASRAVSSAAGSEGCYFVRVSHHKKDRRRYQKRVSSGSQSQSLTAASSPSCRPTGAAGTELVVLPAPIERDPSSGERSAVSSVTSVSSVSMQDRA